jgi:hypothetical protein
MARILDATPISTDSSESSLSPGYLTFACYRGKVVGLSLSCSYLQMVRTVLRPRIRLFRLFDVRASRFESVIPTSSEVTLVLLTNREPLQNVLKSAVIVKDAKRAATAFDRLAHRAFSRNHHGPKAAQT